MKPKQQVLLAIDDETFGKLVLDFVLAHKWENETAFQVIHVIEPPPPFDFPAPYWELAIEKSIKSATELVEQARDRIRKSFPDCLVESKVLEGYPQDQIGRIVRDWPADLIVTGSHGRRGLVKMILGSVSTAVAYQSACSVMVVRPAAKTSSKNCPGQETGATSGSGL